MKKFKNIQQLEDEKKTLARRKAELEKAIRYDWRDVKESLNPVQLAAGFFAKKEQKKEETQSSSVLQDTIAGIAETYLEKLAGKFEQKLTEWMKTGRREDKNTES